MITIQDNRLYYTYDSKHQVRLFEPKIGDKFCATDPYNKDKCLELEKMLRDAGFNTRVAQGEDKYWSVAIIE